MYYGRHRKISIYDCGRLRRVGLEGNVEAISFFGQADVVRLPTRDCWSLNENGKGNFEVAAKEEQNEEDGETEE